MGGRVTPLSMEQLLSNRLKMTIDEFERFIEQSELDLGDEEDELAQLTQVLLKE